MPRTVEGVATLCFLEDGSCFQGILVTAEANQYGLIGKTSKAPRGNYHQCCFDEEPQFFVITVIEYATKKETVIKDVMKTNGDNCSLSCETFKYDTEELYSDGKAESYIKKYFNERFLGKGCYVCIGPMKVDFILHAVGMDEGDSDDNF